MTSFFPAFEKKTPYMVARQRDVVKLKCILENAFKCKLVWTEREMKDDTKAEGGFR